ncbi:MAG: DegQ family serine endoprotease [Denitratisoma sp.]|nr:DegQ family serine endoprotease [Denitratisoma sp.]
MSIRLFFAALLSIIALNVAAQGRELPDFTDLVDKHGTAVVNVSTTQTIRGNRAFPQFPELDEDDPMFEFFKRFIPRQPGIPHDFQNKSLGSGFIISSDGYILTNAHVVDSADEIAVKLTDKREFKAKVIGTDKRTDVALIKIEANGLPTVKLGDPGKLRVGEWVVAIGSPFGFESSVTAGIVSAKGRALPQENFVPFIQTDVAINPGNSGGPLFNMKGEVVGINSQIYSRTGGYMGVAFAIPIDVAMEVQSQLRTSGRVSRGRIGVVIQELTKELADSFGLPKAAGALVNSVEKGGPAEKAGVEAGDIILKFDGKTVNASSDLPRIVGATRPGSKVSMQVWRKGGSRDLTVTVGEIPEEKTAQRGQKRGKQAEATANRLGLVLSELTPEQKRDLKVANGLLVEDVRANGSRADLRPGDVILAVVHKGSSAEAKSVDQFNKLLSQFDKSATITLLVKRGEQQTYITLKGNDDK